MYAKGQELLERGQVYAARKLFERSADMGLAQSAVALAATYESRGAVQDAVMGLPPDPAAARKWYREGARARRCGGV
jgi:TPR repeat protein